MFRREPLEAFARLLLASQFALLPLFCHHPVLQLRVLPPTLEPEIVPRLPVFSIFCRPSGATRRDERGERGGSPSLACRFRTTTTANIESLKAQGRRLTGSGRGLRGFKRAEAAAAWMFPRTRSRRLVLGSCAVAGQDRQPLGCCGAQRSRQEFAACCPTISRRARRVHSTDRFRASGGLRARANCRCIRDAIRSNRKPHHRLCRRQRQSQPAHHLADRAGVFRPRPDDRRLVRIAQ